MRAVGTVSPRRVVVLGVTGSGKTELARRVAQQRGLGVIDRDAILWLPGWVKRPDLVVGLERERARIRALAADGSVPPVVRLTSPRKADAWVAGLERDDGAGTDGVRPRRRD